MIFEKIRERLQEQAERYQESLEGQHCMDYRWIDEEGLQATEEAIDIINQVESEYDSGWIPCSERLPEDCVMCLVTLDNGDVCLGVYRNDDGEWLSRMSQGQIWYTSSNNIIAWMPLPEPYKKGE